MDSSLGDKVTYPLSVVQKQFWLLNQIHPDSAAYNIPSVFRINGVLNIDALEQSINTIISRHGIFRTCFAPEGDQIVQHVAPDARIEVAVENRSEDPEPIDENTIGRIIQSEIEKPFDLTQLPLIRAKVVVVAKNECLLFIVMHHIITDLRTKDLFSEELGALYHAAIHDELSPLAEVKSHYADYSKWQAQWLEKNEHVSLLAYWEKMLAGKDHFLNLPYSFNRPQLQSPKGRAVPFGLSKFLTEKLKTFSREQNANIYLTLLTAYFIVLHRYSGQEAIIVGVPLTNRRNPDFKQVMGCFVSILPIAIDFSNEPSFIHVLKQVRVAMLGAHRNQETPVNILVEHIQPKRDPAYNPLFQAGFTFEHPMKLELDGVECTSVPVHCGGAQLDIFPALWESEEGIRGHIEYCTDLFEESMIVGFVSHYKNLLTAIVDHSERPVSRLPMLSDEEKSQLIHTWNTTDKTYPEEDGIHRFFEKQAEETPDDIAIVFNDERLTYGELNQRANRLAHFLIEKGIKTATPIGIFMERSVEMVVAIYGILKAGGTYVPFDPEYPADRISYMLNDTAAPIILTQEHLADRVSYYSGEVISLDTLWKTLEKYLAVNPPDRMKADDPAYIIYTSGSTGRPKGVINAHRGIINRILWMQNEYTLTLSDSVLQKTPYSFDVSVWEFFWPLMVGAKLIIAPPEIHKDPVALVEIINDQKITTLHFVPSMLKAFLDNANAASCKTIQRVICSGEALSSDLQKQFFDVMDAELHNLYGPTEAAVDVTYWACQRDRASSRVPIGRPVANTTIYILDKHLQPVPVGIPGEIHIGGVQVAIGYLNLPALTDEKFILDPFSGKPGSRLYKTGDLGRFLPDGNIEYIGRTDSQIKIRGFRVELGEIESMLCDHPAVAQAAIVTKAYGVGDVRIIAYITADESRAHAEEHNFIDDVKTAMKSKLPDYMVPASFVLLAKMPLTQSGKVDRRALPEPEMKRSALESEYIPPEGDTEKFIAGLWADLLKLDRVGVEDNFFDLGGTSLLSVYLISQLHARFNRNISVVVFFQHPTIRSLSAYIDSEENGSVSFDQVRKRADLRKKALRRKKPKGPIR